MDRTSTDNGQPTTGKEKPGGHEDPDSILEKNKN